MPRTSFLALLLFGVTAYALTRSRTVDAATLFDPYPSPEFQGYVNDIATPAVLQPPPLNVQTFPDMQTAYAPPEQPSETTMTTLPGDINAFLAMIRKFPFEE